MLARAQVYPKSQKVVCWSQSGKIENVAYTPTFANLLSALLPQVRIFETCDILVIEYSL